MTRRRWPVLVIACGLCLGGLGGLGSPALGAPAPEAKHFLHGDHAKRGVSIDTCQTCHSVDAAGAVLAPAAKGHSPCLDAACHATEFLSVGDKTKKADPAKFGKATAFCLGCHDQVPVPWQKPTTNAVLASFQFEREFHVEMNHYQHTEKAAKKFGTAGEQCRSCHVVDAKSFALVTGTPGHAQCVQCHNAKDFPEFTMQQCNVCHDKPARAEYFAGTRPKNDVRACGSEGAALLEVKLKHAVPCFRHDTVNHRFIDGDAKAKPVQCADCHYMVGDKTKWAGNRYQSIKDLHLETIIDNSKDREHASCGRSTACHKGDVDPVRGAKCTKCHAEKSAF